MPSSKSKHSQHSYVKTLRNAAVATFVLLAVLLVNLYQMPLHHAFSLATTHQPEPYSELYFENSTKLPVNVSLTKPASFMFRVTNHQATTTMYKYIVTQTITGTTKTLTTGTLLLTDGSSASVPVTFAIGTPQSSIVTNVHLIDQNETISFRSQS